MSPTYCGRSVRPARRQVHAGALGDRRARVVAVALEVLVERELLELTRRHAAEHRIGQRAVHHRLRVRPVDRPLDPDREREVDLDRVARAPVALDAHVRARLGVERLRLAVELDRVALGRPPRHAQLDVHVAAAVERELRRLLAREVGLLHDREIALRPVQRARDEQVHVQLGVVGRVEVGRLLVLEVVLHARAAAARAGVAVAAPAARRQRLEVGDVRARVGVGVLARPGDLVEVTALDVVHVLRIRVVQEQVARELDHVVGRARLRAARGDRVGDVVAVLELLDVVVGARVVAARPAVAEHAVRDDHAPEVLRHRVVLLVAALLIDAHVAGEVRHVLVGVQARRAAAAGLRAGRADEDVAVLQAGAEQRLAVVELARDLQEAAVLGQRRDLRHHLVDAAVLAGDVGIPHVVEVAARRRPGVVRVHHVAERQGQERPLGHLEHDLERAVVAGQRVRVEEAADELVLRVPRRPAVGVLVGAVDREARRPDPQHGVLGLAAEVAGVDGQALVGQRVLALAELVDDPRELVLQVGVAGRRGLREHRHVVAGPVAAEQAAVLPAARGGHAATGSAGPASWLNSTRNLRSS